MEWLLVMVGIGRWRRAQVVRWQFLWMGGWALVACWAWSGTLEGGTVAALSEKGTRGGAEGEETRAAFIVAKAPNVATATLSLGLFLAFMASSSLVALRFLIKDETSSKASWTSLWWGVILRLGLVHLLGSGYLHVIALLLGAPLWDRLAKTFLWASIASSVVFLPLSSFLVVLCSTQASSEAFIQRFGLGGRAILARTAREAHRLLQQPFLSVFFTLDAAPRSSSTSGSGASLWGQPRPGHVLTEGEEWMGLFGSLFPATTALLGAWLGAFPGPLDWDLPWQLWPIASTYGLLLGHSLASLLVFAYLSFHPRLRTTITTATPHDRAW